MALGNALKVNSTLTEIRQVYVCIRVDGEHEIMRWINWYQNWRVKLYCSINNNQIGDEGAKAIADALKANSSLIEIS